MLKVKLPRVKDIKFPSPQSLILCMVRSVLVFQNLSFEYVMGLFTIHDMIEMMWSYL